MSEVAAWAGVSIEKFRALPAQKQREVVYFIFAMKFSAMLDELPESKQEGALAAVARIAKDYDPEDKTSKAAGLDAGELEEKLRELLGRTFR